MLKLDPEHRRRLRDAVYGAAGQAAVRATVQSLHDELQRDIDDRRPICTASGRCCRFEEFGHRLFVTTIELAAFVYALELGDWPEELSEARRRWDGRGCPFQIHGLCGVHAIRPLGCRVFFCDPTAADWQTGQYERFHGRLKELHEALGVPYFYVEWREALAALGLTAAGPAVARQPDAF